MFLGTFSNYNEFHLYAGILTTIFLLLAILNRIGKRYCGNLQSHWLKLPYITTMITIVIAYITLVLTSSDTDRMFVIWYPIIVPLLSWIWQFIFMDKFTGEEQKRMKALILGVPLFIALLAMAGSVILNTFKFVTLSVTAAICLAFINTVCPMDFTRTSEYWHPELKQSRYDGKAMAALRQTKSIKKTDQQKMKLRK
ncbi:hypothetical protein RR47_GL001208 [Enterococcus columbae DSM 7374 = ATCC 51263]|nr:hypothetical protein RR47_GL001208 [Enterococcus columbae DSM 7374 = ATCC 51263]